MTTPQPSPTDPDEAVDAEWRKIEAERIAEEREEAREDALDPEPHRRRWSWWAFAAALVAGGILAAALNSSRVARELPATSGGGDANSSPEPRQ